MKIITGLAWNWIWWYSESKLKYKTKKDNDKSIREDTVQDTVLATKLDYISKGVDDIRLDFKAQAREIQDIKMDIVKLKESSKSAHHRLDGLEEIKKEGI